MNFDARRPVQLSSGESYAPHEAWPVRSWLSTLVWLLACLTLSLWLTGCGGGDAEPAEPQVSVRVGPAGGTVTGPDGAQVIIPAGALSGTVTIGITRTARGAPAAAPEGTVPVDGTYEFTPHDTTFLKPVTLRLPVKSGATGNDVFMASPGGDWQSYDATVSGGFAEWQRNSFSWGYIGACTIPAGNTDPYPCVYTRGYAFASATPPTAITRQTGGYQGNFAGSAGAWLVNEASTVQLTLTYQAPPDCVNPRAKLIRVDPTLALSAPNRVTTLLDQAVGLSLITLSPPPGAIGSGGGSTSRQRLAGTTTFDVSFSHADTIANVAGQHVFGFTFSCNRPGKPKMTGGDLMTFTSVVPAPTVTHTIGGSVSGLTGSGLVLQNNSGNDLPVSANGSFSFSTPVGAGAPYAVTVSTQPSGQTCSVANGNGTANGAVNNVAVTCVATGATHAIIGHVTSTASGPVVLQNNGTDTLTVASNTPFTFPTRIATGAPYNVTVLTPPAGQSCSVQNGTGLAPQVTGAEVQIHCTTSTGRWRGAELRESTADGVWGGSARVVFDASGNALALWVQGIGLPVSNLWTARYTPTGGWETPQVSSTGGGNAANAQFGFDGSGNGNGMLVWSEYDRPTARYNIWARRYINGAWGAASLLENDDSGFALNTHIGLDASGNAVATWEQQTSGSTYRVVASTFQSGAWQMPVFVGPGSGSAGQSTLAVFPNGSAIATWIQSGTGGSQVWSNRFDGTSWGTAGAVTTSQAGDSSAAQVKGDSQGNAIVVWTQDNGTQSDVFASRQTSAGTWSTPVRMRTSSNNGSGYSSIDMNASGQAIVVWVEEEGTSGSSGLWSRAFLPSLPGGWDNAVRVEIPGGGGLNPQVAINNAGAAVIGWARNTVGFGLDEDMVAFQGSVTAGSWVGPSVLSQGSMAGAAWGDVAIDSSGNAIALWQQFDVTRSGRLDLWSNVFK
jgi:hypothetical protein